MLQHRATIGAMEAFHIRRCRDKGHTYAKKWLAQRRSSSALLDVHHGTSQVDHPPAFALCRELQNVVAIAMVVIGSRIENSTTSARGRRSHAFHFGSTVKIGHKQYSFSGISRDPPRDGIDRLQHDVASYHVLPRRHA